MVIFDGVGARGPDGVGVEGTDDRGGGGSRGMAGNQMGAVGSGGPDMREGRGAGGPDGSC